MSVSRFTAIALLLPSVALADPAGSGLAAQSNGDGEYAPRIDPADFQATVDNPFYPLVPGTIFKYVEKTRDGKRKDVILVTHDTKVIMGVTCTVVSDKVTRKGKLEEETLDWYAQDKAGNVWYFGEDTKEYDANGNVSTEGSWESGVNGGQPGIIMMAHPAVGDPYRQEYGKGVAEDMGQIIAIDKSVTVPFGVMTGCVKTKEWSLLESGYAHKWYAKGVGCVREKASTSYGRETSKLVSVTKP